ncbi:uncharacterized protein [Chironomus tepperi]|uniref:uncharacterized protein isoform X1 n=1 Tax=Chironomus tepperi TaxID=113505 RepID=UPI00391FA2C3
MVAEKEVPLFVKLIIGFVIVISIICTFIRIYYECCLEEEEVCVINRVYYECCLEEGQEETTIPEPVVITSTGNSRTIRIEVDEQIFQEFLNHARTSQASPSHSTRNTNTRTPQASPSYSTRNNTRTPRPSAPRRNSDDPPDYNDVMDGLYGHKK